MKTNLLGMAAAITATLAIGAGPAWAAAGDGMLGGPPASGGVADETVCPDGEAVVGIEGATRIIGGFIPVVAVATVHCTADAAGSTMGAGTGTTGSTTCPEGQVAIGVTGREGDFVDNISLRCQDAGGTGPITTTDGFGGAFGTADGPYDCPAGMVLTGLSGQSVFDGGTIRYVEIVCAPGMVDEDGDGIADTPPPTEKAQCFDGAWASFNNPTFRNQGQCVSYVATQQ